MWHSLHLGCYGMKVRKSGGERFPGLHIFLKLADIGANILDPKIQSLHALKSNFPESSMHHNRKIAPLSKSTFFPTFFGGGGDLLWEMERNEFISNLSPPISFATDQFSIFVFSFFLHTRSFFSPDYFQRRACQKALNSSPKKWSFSFAGNLVRKLPCIRMRLAQFLADFLL